MRAYNIASFLKLDSKTWGGKKTEIIDRGQTFQGEKKNLEKYLINPVETEGKK